MCVRVRLCPCLCLCAGACCAGRAFDIGRFKWPRFRAHRRAGRNAGGGRVRGAPAALRSRTAGRRNARAATCLCRRAALLAPGRRPPAAARRPCCTAAPHSISAPPSRPTLPVRGPNQPPAHSPGARVEPRQPRDPPESHRRARHTPQVPAGAGSPHPSPNSRKPQASSVKRQASSHTSHTSQQQAEVSCSARPAPN